MAGEIGHVVYAARMLTYLGEKVQDPIYWIGTLFPDIRHIGITSRHLTHPTGVTVTTLLGKNDFVTGMRVHSWIDATREYYLRTQHMKETLPWHPFVPHALKLMEDEFLYDHFDDWNLIHRLLNQVNDNELSYIASRDHIHSWHTILQDYFKEKPTDASRLRLSTHIGISEASAEELNQIVNTLKKDGRAQQMLNDFLQHLEKILV